MEEPTVLPPPLYPRVKQLFEGASFAGSKNSFRNESLKCTSGTGLFSTTIYNNPATELAPPTTNDHRPSTLL